MKFSHMLEIGFTFEDYNKSPRDSSRADILDELEKRLCYLRTCSIHEFKEAFGYCDTYPIKVKTFYVVILPDGKVLSNEVFGPCIYSNTVEATKKKRRFNGIRVEKYNPKKHGESQFYNP